MCAPSVVSTTGDPMPHDRVVTLEDVKGMEKKTKLNLIMPHYFFSCSYQFSE